MKINKSLLKEMVKEEYENHIKNLTIEQKLRDIIREEINNIVNEGIAQKHQKNIAIKTLKMSDIGANIMGGMSKNDARKYLKSIGYSDLQIQKIEK